MRSPFEIVKESWGVNRVLLLGHQVFSYERNRTYARRFAGLSAAEIRAVLEWQFSESGNAYALDLDNPKTLNEKLNWLKLNYHDPLMTRCADKVGVRSFIRDRAGDQYLVPVCGVYDSPDDIDFDALPDKFVLKVNWGSGQNVICRDKSALDLPSCRNRLARWMKPESNHYFNHFEWCYRDIVPKIVAEEYIESEGSLTDYKFYCYSGEPKNMVIIENRGTPQFSETYFDDGFRRLPFEWMCKSAAISPRRPDRWDEMIAVARQLAEPFPFVRVDFYVLPDGSLRVGELTFYPGAGLGVFSPPEWDLRLGEMLSLPEGRP